MNPEIEIGAHGRVNLIGEHTDYNGGFVLPTSIPQSARVKLKARADRHVTVASTHFAATIEYDLGKETARKDWADYIQGVTFVLRQAGYSLRGFDCRIDSDVPMGSGLSSSAALEVSLLKGLNELFALDLTPVEIAQLGQKVENDFVGARVGIMDQMAASLGSHGEALFIDTNDLSFRRVDLPSDEMELIVINSGISHSNAHGGYNQRRSECEEACKLLGIKQLRDLGPESLGKLKVLPQPLRGRAHHVITENARVLAAVQAIEAKDFVALGKLFNLSHSSMRDDYEVSVPEVDLLVKLAIEHEGVFGARLTGGGFGGSIVALARPGEGARIAREIREAYFKETGIQATILVPKSEPVQVREDTVMIPTYEPLPPDKHPMFLENRVYQGSSGKVYPLPVYNRIADAATEHHWRAVHLENDFIKLMVLPELGGRIHIGCDKTNGYDFFYRQNVIKPALVGLTGPWISGGVEFNWPQHHRPATHMPVDVHLEEHADGSKTAWMSDHDPLSRMKGMHGICLHPGKAVIELKVRVYNRTPVVQTFLWWANVATRVHEGYQSFFPPDVTFVADHAKRATVKYPLCQGKYYGIDYGARARQGVPADETPAQFTRGGNSSIPPYAANDLTWFANIPVPTSYMCVESQQDFFGGYDHLRRAGLVHVANHHISPGKKQWTWGNQEFGYAWDRNLTDSDGPYIELMAGVYTDNQPDFSYLQPGETKTWSQFWYPIQEIGPVQQANILAAVALHRADGRIRLGVSVTEAFPQSRIQLSADGRKLHEWTKDLAPGNPFTQTAACEAQEVELKVFARDGKEIISYRPVTAKTGDVPAAATEPKMPPDIDSQDELYLTGLHLAQYRHATCKPELYWREALRRDPGDSRCLNSLGLWHLRRGEFVAAKGNFGAAIAHLTARNPNPYDGEAYYNLGLALRHLGEYDAAYAAFYKATWNQAWQGAGYHALSELDCRKADWPQALDHIERSLRLNTDNLRARDLRALILRQLPRFQDAEVCLRETLTLDPLDWWARHLLGEEITCSTQTRFDLVLDFASAGFFKEALALLENVSDEPHSGTGPMVDYYRGWLCQNLGDPKAALRFYQNAASRDSSYCFPARLEEIAMLEQASARNPLDAKAPFYLGNLYYDKDRHQDAIRCWELSAARDAKFSIVWRNLGIAYFNVSRKPPRALKAFANAFRLNPQEPRLLYERDQLWKRVGKSPRLRLKELERHLPLVNQRDDLAVELCALYNQTGLTEKALAVIARRKFQPWEGGEGLALATHVRTHLLLGDKAMDKGQYAQARDFFSQALTSPHHLGEAKHPLANQSDIHYRLGIAYQMLGDKINARKHWQTAAEFQGDFQNMRVCGFSEMTYYSARALEALGKKAAAHKMDQALLAYAKALAKQEAKIDYFATSLPTMLLFNDDLQAQQSTTALFLRALAEFGLGRKAAAKRLFTQVLKRDPAHASAHDFLNKMARKV